MSRSLSNKEDTRIRAAISVLNDYAQGWEGAPNTCPHDAGPVVLAHLLHAEGVLPDALGRSVGERWMREQTTRIRALGAFGGLGGLLAGIHALAELEPELALPTGMMAGKIRQILAAVEWQMSSVVWADYDLFRGPAGLVLTGVFQPDWSEAVIPAANQLSIFCDTPALDRLRAGPDIDPRSAFNIGRINTGMGHGVTGVASALRQAAETFEENGQYLLALRRCCDWLVEEAYLAEGEFITWPPVGRDGAKASTKAHQRQAWCYGTPGVAWTLWDAGRVLGDSSLQLLGVEAMRSFCRIFDADQLFAKDDVGWELAICHGAAGTLAVADAFACHTNLPEAARLRDYLETYLLERIDQIIGTAHRDMTLLNGAGGALSALLTVRGKSRGWLTQIALR